MTRVRVESFTGSLDMFGPVRGPWPDASWKGCWGDDPPFHAPVFVLTHHARPPLEGSDKAAHGVLRRQMQ